MEQILLQYYCNSAVVKTMYTVSISITVINIELINYDAINYNIAIELRRFAPIMTILLAHQHFVRV